MGAERRSGVHKQGWRAAKLVRGPDFCSRIHIGKEKNYQQYQQFPKLRLEQRMASLQTQAAQINEEAGQHEEMNLSFWLYDPMW
jgi:hypothetical protein